MMLASVTKLPAPGAPSTVVLRSPMVLPWQTQQPQRAVTANVQQQKQPPVVSAGYPVPAIRPNTKKFEDLVTKFEGLATKEDNGKPTSKEDDSFDEPQQCIDNAGVHTRPITETERRLYVSIYDKLYLEAATCDDDVESEPRKPLACCTNLCCHSSVCKHVPKIAERGLKLTPILRHGRAKGWKMLADIINPLLHSLPIRLARIVWQLAELLTTVIAFTLSLLTFRLGNNAGFNALHLAVASLSTLLAVIDVFVNLKPSFLTVFNALTPCFKACNREVNSVTQSQSEDGEGESETQQQITMIEEAKVDLETQCQMTNSENDSQCCKSNKCCNKCTNCCTIASDFIRVILTELILYPLLVCDIFELVTGQTYKGGTTASNISFALFIISLLSLVFYVYIIRLVVLAVMIHYVRKQRTIAKDSRGVDHDPSIGKSALTFQSLFFAHVLGQMLAQIFILIAIGGKIQFDNRHLLDSSIDIKDEQIHVSSNLWYMIVSGYILPIAGVLTFFIVAYYWVQEFPIGICIDLLSILELPGANTILYPNKSMEETRGKVSKIMRFVHFAELKQQYKVMRGMKWFGTKFLYPFRTIKLVILSMIYSIFPFAFTLCAIFTDGTTVMVLYGGNWVFIYITGVIVGVTANAYVFAVAAIWSTSIILVAIITVTNIVIILSVTVLLIVVVAIICIPCLLIIM